MAPEKTGQDASDSECKWYTNSSLEAFFWLSRVRKIWVTYWNHSMEASIGRIWSLVKKNKSRSGQNWTVW